MLTYPVLCAWSVGPEAQDRQDEGSRSQAALAQTGTRPPGPGCASGMAVPSSGHGRAEKVARDWGTGSRRQRAGPAVAAERGSALCCCAGMR